MNAIHSVHDVLANDASLTGCALFHDGNMILTFSTDIDHAVSATCETLCRRENAISGCHDDVVDDVIDVVSCTIQTHHCGPSTKEANFQNWIRKLQGERHGFFSNFALQELVKLVQSCMNLVVSHWITQCVAGAQ